MFSSTSKEGVGNGVKMLIYGRAGAGKTYMARTAPKPLVISAESGLLSLRDVDLPVYKVGNLTDLITIFDWLQVPANRANFHSVYLDSISEIAEAVLSNAKATAKDPRQAYGELIEKMNMTIKGFRDLDGIHVIMVAKQEAHKDEVTMSTNFGPAMPGAKLGQQVPYLFDEVLRLGIGTGQDAQGAPITYRFLQTQPDLQYEAKDRSGALAPMEPPDLSHIINKIMSSVSQPPVQ